MAKVLVKFNQADTDAITKGNLVKRGQGFSTQSLGLWFRTEEDAFHFLPSLDYLGDDGSASIGVDAVGLPTDVKAALVELYGDIDALGGLSTLDTIADAQVASDAAIAWTKISKSGAVASDVGAAPVVGGKIPAEYLPAIAVAETFTVASEAAMLALVAQVGDYAIRTDQSGRKYVLAGSASTLADWIQLTDTSPVLSVDGDVGVVVLSGRYAPLVHDHDATYIKRDGSNDLTGVLTAASAQDLGSVAKPFGTGTFTALQGKADGLVIKPTAGAPFTFRVTAANETYWTDYVNVLFQQETNTSGRSPRFVFDHDVSIAAGTFSLGEEQDGSLNYHRFDFKVENADWGGGHPLHLVQRVNANEYRMGTYWRTVDGVGGFRWFGRSRPGVPFAQNDAVLGWGATIGFTVVNAGTTSNGTGILSNGFTDDDPLFPNEALRWAQDKITFASSRELNLGSSDRNGTMDASRVLFADASNNLKMGTITLAGLGGITQAQGDARYLQLSGGTIIGNLSITGSLGAASITEGGTALATKYAAAGHTHTALGSVQFSGSLTFDADGTRDIGASGAKAGTVWAATGRFGTLFVTGLATTQALIADANGSRDVGSSGTRYATGFFTALNASGTIAGDTVNATGTLQIGGVDVTTMFATAGHTHSQYLTAVTRDATLSGAGTVASPLTINLANANGWTGKQTITPAAGSVGLAISNGTQEVVQFWRDASGDGQLWVNNAAGTNTFKVDGTAGDLDMAGTLTVSNSSNLGDAATDIFIRTGKHSYHYAGAEDNYLADYWGTLASYDILKQRVYGPGSGTPNAVYVDHKGSGGTQQIWSIDDAHNYILFAPTTFAGRVTWANNNASLDTTSTSPTIYATSTGGSYPFNANGHMIIQSRPSGGDRDILFVAGATPSIKTVIKATGWLEHYGNALVGGIMELGETAAPATPASSYGRLWAGTDGKVYYKNDAGETYDLTATGGSGGGIPEAPTDGGLYARSMSNWSAIQNRWGLTGATLAPLDNPDHVTIGFSGTPLARLHIGVASASSSIIVTGSSAGVVDGTYVEAGTDAYGFDYYLRTTGPTMYISKDDSGAHPYWCIGPALNPTYFNAYYYKNALIATYDGLGAYIGTTAVAENLGDLCSIHAEACIESATHLEAPEVYANSALYPKIQTLDLSDPLAGYAAIYAKADGLYHKTDSVVSRIPFAPKAVYSILSYSCTNADEIISFTGSNVSDCTINLNSNAGWYGQRKIVKNLGTVAVNISGGIRTIDTVGGTPLVVAPGDCVELVWTVYGSGTSTWVVL